MNKKITDSDLDVMLRNYCTRKSQIAFDVKTEKVKSEKTRSRLMYALTSAFALALVFSVVCAQFTQTSRSTSPKGFSISASAAEREPVMLQSVNVELCPKEEKGIAGDIVFENGYVSLEPIWFSMSGEDIETFDYKCENGLLYYVIPELKLQMLEDSNSTITQDDYFKKGQELKSIPYNSNDPNYIFVSWFSYRLDEEASEHFDKDIAQIADEDMRNYRTERLKTDEDFSYFFGDTINVTAHYKDGTRETAVIEVTVDTTTDGDKTYGNYVLKYK